MYDLFKNVIPHPACAATRTGRFSFGKVITAWVPEGFSVERKNIMNVFWHQFTMTAGTLKIRETSVLQNRIVFGSETEGIKGLGEYEYALKVTPEGIVIDGKDEESLIRGFALLLQLIRAESLKEGEESLYVSCCEVFDKPVFSFRCLHLCVFPETTLSYLQRTIRIAGLFKFNYLILEFWGMLKYDCLPELAWPNAYEKAQIKPLIQEAKALGMEIIPMFNHLGHAAQSRVRNGRHVVLNQNPKLSLLFEPDGWTWCLSNPDTLDLLRSIRQELIELCGEGHFFHIGCDEAYSFATCDLCSQKDSHELLIAHLNGLAEELGEQGRRAIMWGDMLLERAAWPDPTIACSRFDQRTHEILPRLSKKLILADWQYNIVTPDVPSSEYFIQQGFDTVICPWEDNRNILSCGEAAQNMSAFGLMPTTWHTLPEHIALLPNAAQACWMGKNAPRGEAGEYMVSKMGELMRKTLSGTSYTEIGWSDREVDYYKN